MKRSLVLPIAMLTVQCGHDEVTAPTIPGPEFVSVDAGLEHTCARTESNESMRRRLLDHSSDPVHH